LSRTELRHTASFLALDEEGRERELHVWTTFIGVGTLESRNEWMEGLAEIRTLDGLPVNYLEKGQYQVVATGSILRSSDPKAP
jgi:hypothetical protein